MQYITTPHAILLAQNGIPKLLWTEGSGRIVFREKAGTLIGVPHPGIEIGSDEFGNRWILHHHFINKYPILCHENEFAQGLPILYDSRQVYYNRREIVERAIWSWQNGKEYHWLWQNCQHFVNNVARNDHSSESVNQVADGALIASVIMGLLGAAFDNKALIKSAFVIGGTGAALKVGHRIVTNPALPGANNIRRISF